MTIPSWADKFNTSIAASIDALKAAKLSYDTGKPHREIVAHMDSARTHMLRAKELSRLIHDD